MKIVFATSFVFLTTSLAQASVLHVPLEFTALQEAIDSAAVGDTVLVGPGTYTGSGNVNLTFHGKDIVLLSSAGPEATVIDCESTSRGLWIRDGETFNARLQGFTIQNGWSDGGGAVRIDSSDFTIQDCLLFSNQAPGAFGGAIHAGPGADVRVERCELRGNSAQYGGAMALVAPGSDALVYHSLLTGNRADRGGAIFGNWMEIDSCTFSGNLAEEYGGALYVYSWPGSFINCTRSIFFGDSAETGNEIVDVASGAPYTACCLIDTTNSSTGWTELWPVYGDPGFCDPVPAEDAPTILGDYRISDSSPATSGECDVIGGQGIGCSIATSVTTVATDTQPGFYPSVLRAGTPILLTSSGTNPGTYRIYSFNGRLIASGNAYQIETHAMDSGVYFLETTDPATVTRITILR